MFQDRVTVEASYQRFLKRVVEKEKVFYLSNEGGVANSVSNDDEEIVVLLFWSDKAYSKRAKGAFKEAFEEVEMDLFDFLYRWLPGMSGDGILAGVNWDGNLIGIEVNPFELREAIEKLLPDNISLKYEGMYEELSKKT